MSDWGEGEVETAIKVQALIENKELSSIFYLRLFFFKSACSQLSSSDYHHCTSNSLSSR
ncbi:hypothetical protein SLEP1_g2669 [Rubroshorea leprosula]|uniref:Uncharacterized protein n=1 Tax=Rubroshorea leprosula TaxID=152421 RepID=A0AAV5HNW3_9ROSI|nr:hypothetical protein SLEP1_g2669 [Rubroshorea leprosula]